MLTRTSKWFQKSYKCKWKAGFKQQNLVYAEIATCGHIYMTRLCNEPSNAAIKEFGTKHESYSRKKLSFCYNLSIPMSSNWMHGLCATALGTKGWWPPYLCMVFLVSLLLMNKKSSSFSFALMKCLAFNLQFEKCLWTWCDWWWQALWFCEQKRGWYIVTICHMRNVVFS